MNTPTQILPDGYVQSDEINLKKNKPLTILLNIFAFFIFSISFALLSIFGTVIRLGMVKMSGSISTGSMLIMLGSMVFILVIHELIHGLFFWMFSRSKPVLAIRLLYAYAGAPAWFFPKHQYALIALVPLVMIGVVGLLLIMLVPASWFLMIAFLVALNTGGAVGDLFVFVRLLKLSPTGFTNDTGDLVTFFEHRVAVL